MKKLLTILLLFPLLIKAQTYQATDTVYWGPGEYAVAGVQSLTAYLCGLSGNAQLMGTNQAGTPGVATHCITAVTTQQFLSAWGMLHGFAGIDVNGYAHIVGDNADGQYGDGTSSFTYAANKLTVDSAGNAFNNLVAMAAFFTGNAHNGWLAIKTDGTLWIWGNLTDNMRANGTGGGTFVKPVQVTIPGGRSAIQVLGGFIALVLCSDGTVWSWGSGAGTYASLGYAGSGSQWATIRQVTGLTGITQIAGGEQWNWAYNSTTNKLYRWGLYGNYLGKSDGTGTGRGNAISVPEEATEVETALGMPTLSISKMVVNSDATAWIMSNGTLHTCGEGAQGNIGNGIELNYATYTYPYSFDLGTPGVLLQILPVQIGYRTDWKDLYASSTFCYQWYAMTTNKDTYTWGRNKGMVTDSIGIATSDLVGQYSNSLDVLSPHKVNRYTNKTWYTTSPWCISNPGATYCSEFTHGPYHALTPNAGVDQLITTNTASLSGSVGDTTVSVLWSIISGPGSPHLLSNTDRGPVLNNLSAGATTARMTVVNNGFVSYTDDVIITYTPGTPCCRISRPVKFTLKP